VIVDEHTGFVIREELCTGCALCVVSCASIKHDLFGFANAHSYVEVTRQPEEAYGVRFTDECDGCCYCLKFCAFDAIERPEGWAKAPHLDEITRRHRAAAG
jgi:Fe-S-cluster-containing dehydrogenase component